MHPSYEDIIERAGVPDWYDENGTPRYGEFDHDALDIYIDYAALIEIACQDCGKKFRVAMCDSRSRHYMKHVVGSGLSDEEAAGYLLDKHKGVPPFHYGDPPRHGRQNSSGDDQKRKGCVGDTMNSEPLRVLEFWFHPGASYNWKRDPNREGKIPSWMDGGDDEKSA